MLLRDDSSGQHWRRRHRLDDGYHLGHDDRYDHRHDDRDHDRHHDGYDLGYDDRHQLGVVERSRADGCLQGHRNPATHEHGAHRRVHR
jgi:hypothetical protein